MDPTALKDFIYYPPPLIAGNQKLGRDVWHFALPAGSTCPGETKGKGGCDGCYAKAGHYLLSSVASRYAVNDAMRKRSDFSHRVRAQIALEGVRYCRVHSSGDFDSPEYVELWHEIAKARKHTQFFAYTRSWRTEEGDVAKDYVKVFRKLAKLSNFQLWFSSDVITGQPPSVPGVLTAHLAIDREPAGFPVDLVFRMTRKEYAITVGDTLVCPVERQRRSGDQVKKLTCSTCKLCFARADWLRKRNEQAVTPG